MRNMNVKQKKRVKHRLFVEQGGKCYLCGKPMGQDATFDHVVPRAMGAAWGQTHNLKLAHKACNGKKAAKPLTEVTDLVSLGSEPTQTYTKSANNAPVSPTEEQE